MKDSVGVLNNKLEIAERTGELEDIYEENPQNMGQTDKEMETM